MTTKKELLQYWVRKNVNTVVDLRTLADTLKFMGLLIPEEPASAVPTTADPTYEVREKERDLEPPTDHPEPPPTVFGVPITWYNSANSTIEKLDAQLGKEKRRADEAEAQLREAKNTIEAMKGKTYADRALLDRLSQLIKSYEEG